MRWHDGFWRSHIPPLTDRTAKQNELQMKTNWSAIRTGCLALAVLCASTGFADVCSVPSVAHPSIQAAVDDAACTEVVLAAQVFSESVAVSRSLVLRGDSSATTKIAGQVTVTGDATEVTLQDLQVDGGGCFPVALDVSGGAQVTSQQDVVVTNAAGEECPIFLDGFESGNTSAWSNTVGEVP
jgi:hypothetical protein